MGPRVLNVLPFGSCFRSFDNWNEYLSCCLSVNKVKRVNWFTFSLRRKKYSWSSENTIGLNCTLLMFSRWRQLQPEKPYSSHRDFVTTKKCHMTCVTKAHVVARCVGIFAGSSRRIHWRNIFYCLRSVMSMIQNPSKITFLFNNVDPYMCWTIATCIFALANQI